jgi:hypothetical protein
MSTRIRGQARSQIAGDKAATTRAFPDGRCQWVGLRILMRPSHRVVGRITAFLNLVLNLSRSS